MRKICKNHLISSQKLMKTVRRFSRILMAFSKAKQKDETIDSKEIENTSFLKTKNQTTRTIRKDL